jgi:hypothetical protein
LDEIFWCSFIFVMEIWQLFNRINALCRKYNVYINILNRGNDCVYIELRNGDIDYYQEIRWNFMKMGVHALLDEIEKELKRIRE